MSFLKNIFSNKAMPASIIEDPLEACLHDTLSSNYAASLARANANATQHSQNATATGGRLIQNVQNVQNIQNAQNTWGAANLSGGAGGAGGTSHSKWGTLLPNAPLADAFGSNVPRATMQDLESGVYAMSLDSVQDMWELRFADRWVSIPDMRAQQDAVFYELAQERLRNAGRFEVVMVPSAPNPTGGLSGGVRFKIIPRTK